MGKKKRQEEGIEEELDEREGQEPDEVIQEPDAEQEGEGGQEPRNGDESQEDDDKQESGRIDLDALPDDVRTAFEELLAQLRRKNREARNLRKRLNKLTRGEGEDGKGKPGGGGESGQGNSEGEDEKRKLLQELEQLRREREELRRSLREKSLTQVVQRLARKAKIRPEAYDEVEALVRVRLGEDAFDDDKPDEEEIADFIAELLPQKPHWVQPKPQRKPNVRDGAGKRGGRRAPSANADEERKKELKTRFGIDWF